MISAMSFLQFSLPMKLKAFSLSHLVNFGFGFFSVTARSRISDPKKARKIVCTRLLKVNNEMVQNVELLFGNRPMPMSFIQYIAGKSYGFFLTIVVKLTQDGTDDYALCITCQIK